MDSSLPDEGKREDWGARRAASGGEPSVDRADLFWTLFGIMVLVTFLVLVVAKG